MRLLNSLGLLLTLLHATLADRNHTADETDSSITYVPRNSWELSGGPLDMGGNHMLTMDPTAFALFNFTGVALYFAYPLWPYRVTTDLSLDGGRPVTLDMQDFNSPSRPEGRPTVASAFHLVFNNLENREHQVRVSVPPGDPYAIVDMFLYTTLEADPSSSSSSSSSPTPTQSQPSPTANDTADPSADPSSQSTQGSKSPTLAIALGSVGAIAGAGLIFLLLMIYIRRHKAKAEAELPPMIKDGDTSSTSPDVFGLPPGALSHTDMSHRSWGTYYPVSLPSEYRVEPELGTLMPSDTSGSRYTGTGTHSQSQWTGSTGSRYMSLTHSSRS